LSTIREERKSPFNETPRSRFEVLSAAISHYQELTPLWPVPNPDIGCQGCHETPPEGRILKPEMTENQSTTENQT
jgi:hypothetical protein